MRVPSPDDPPWDCNAGRATALRDPYLNSYRLARLPATGVATTASGPLQRPAPDRPAACHRDYNYRLGMDTGLEFCVPPI